MFLMMRFMIFAKTLKYHYVFKVLWDSGVAKNRVWDPPGAKKLQILYKRNGNQ